MTDRLKWLLHNVVAHPLLVLCPPLGRRLHDRTAPGEDLDGPSPRDAELDAAVDAGYRALAGGGQHVLRRALIGLLALCGRSVAHDPEATLAEIDEQREKGWPDFHPEDFCHRCGGRNVPSWFVDSDRFNAAFGPPSEHPYNGIVCPGCFAVLHEQATGLRTTWRLVPDSPFRPAVHIDGSEGGSDAR